MQESICFNMFRVWLDMFWSVLYVSIEFIVCWYITSPCSIWVAMQWFELTDTSTCVVGPKLYFVYGMIDLVTELAACWHKQMIGRGNILEKLQVPHWGWKMKTSAWHNWVYFSLIELNCIEYKLFPICIKLCWTYWNDIHLPDTHIHISLGWSRAHEIRRRLE